MPTDGLRVRLLAVLAADAVGYSRLMSTDPRSTVSALDAARAVFSRQVASHGGRVVDTAGDSVLSVFDSAEGALQAALAVQRELHRDGIEVPAHRQLRFRIGIHVGDVVEKADGTVYGDGVNLAARLEGLAEPGALAISQALHDMVGRRIDVAYEDGGEHRVKNIVEPLRVYRVRAVERTLSEPGAAPVPPAPPLPAHRDPLFGRSALLRQLCDTLALPQTRLCTLTGPGGTGKTLLALRATEQLAPRMADGAHVVLLAPLRNSQHIMRALAAALGMQEAGAASLAAVVHGYLLQREVLLLLDNLKHLPGAGAEVAALLAACPKVKVLATSRVLLRLSGEVEIKVPPLALPATDDGDDATASPAVALFAARAARLGRDVLSSADERRVAVRICRRLDGLPLAIELAASRLRALSPAALLERLQHRLPLLKGGAADAPERQQTLRLTIAWSHDLLDDAARLLFRRLGVFAGGWSLEAAQAMLDGDSLDALDPLEALIDHNLVQRDDDLGGQPRYTMLETIREYALEQLVAIGEGELARARHASFCLSLAVSAAPHLTSAGRLPWLQRLRAETNNLRVALDRLVRERPDTDAALALTAALTWLWYFDGLYREGLGWMGAAMELPGAQAPTAATASVLSGMARLASFSGEMALAHRQAARSIEIWRTLDNPRGLGFALFHQGVPALMSEGRVAAVAVLQEARQCFAAVDDAWGVALSIVYEGVVRSFHPGDEAAAEQALQEGLARSQALGDEWAASTCNAYLGNVAFRRGDLVTARRGCTTILEVARQTGDRFRLARASHLMAELNLRDGRPADALAQMSEALTLAIEQGRMADAPQLLRGIARALVGLGQHERAATLLGVVAPPHSPRSTLPSEDTGAVAAGRAACSAALGEPRCDHLEREGAELPLERAIERAQGWARDLKASLP